MPFKLEKNCISLLLILSILFFSFASSNASVFEDVKGHWAEEAIMSAYEKGIINGVDEVGFQPNRAVTRAEFIQMLFNFKKDHSNKDVDFAFKDVNTTDWYCNAVVWGSSNKYILGYDDKFYPDDNIKRQDAFTVFCRFMNMLNPYSDSANIFSDSDQIFDYSLPYISYLVDNGFVKGYLDNTIRPGETLTRAEAVVLVCGALSKQEEQKEGATVLATYNSSSSKSSGGSGGGGSQNNSNDNTEDINKPLYEDGYYKISNSGNFAWLLNVNNKDKVKSMLSSSFILTNNIDMSQYYFSIASASKSIPVGDEFIPMNPLGDLTNPFCGIFDGKGYKITSLDIYMPNIANISIFGCNTGTIKNINIENAVIDGAKNTALLVSNNKGNILTSSVKGTVKANGDNIGGVCALNSGKVSQVLSVVEITSEYSCAGGIAGVVNGGVINTCNSYGSININGESAGGIVGYADADSTVNYNITGIATITATDNTGGIVGFAGKALVEKNISLCNILNVIKSNGEQNNLASIQKNIGRIAGKTNTYSALLSNYANISTILFVNECVVSIEKKLCNGIDITASDMKTQSFYTDVGWFSDESKWLNASDGMPSILCCGENNQPQKIQDIELMDAPGFNQETGYSGEGSAEKLIKIKVKLSNIGYVKWAAVESGTQNPQLTYNSKDANSNDIICTGSSKEFEINVEDSSLKYDVYLKSESLDKIEMDENNRFVISDVRAQMFCNGDGSEEKPYIIENSTQFLRIEKKQGVGINFKLKDSAVIELGSLNSSLSIFNGILDGNMSTGAKLTNLTEVNADGLFKQVSQSSTIKNLAIENANIKWSDNFVGVITGTNYGTINNCYALNANVEGALYVGGLVGNNKSSGVIKNSFVTTSGTNQIKTIVWACGGIAGNNEYGNIENCYFAGNVTSSNSGSNGQLLGGITGNTNGGTISNCYASGFITGPSAGCDFGGITGVLEGSGTIKNCVSLIRQITSTSSSGRIAGKLTSGQLTNNYAYFDMGVSCSDKGVNGRDGLDLTYEQIANMSTYISLGWDSNIWVKGNGSYVLPLLKNIPDTVQEHVMYIDKDMLDDDIIAIRTVDDLKAVTGNNKYKLLATIDLSDISWTSITNFKGTFDGNSSAGYKIINLNGSCAGLFDTLGSGHYVKNLVIDSVNIERSADDAGALARVASYGTIENCAVVNAKVKASTSVGGLVSKNDHSTIKSCFVEASGEGEGIISGAWTAGGLVAYNEFGWIYDCYFRGIVKTESTGANAKVIGGIVGNSIGNGSEHYVARCYVAGSIIGDTGGSKYGGIVGQAYQEGGNWKLDVRDSFALLTSITDTESTGRVTSETIAGRLSNNYSLDSCSSTDKGVTKKDGADITLQQAQNISTYSDAGWSSSVWTASEGTYKYPILTGIPVDIQQN